MEQTGTAIGTVVQDSPSAVSPGSVITYHIDLGLRRLWVVERGHDFQRWGLVVGKEAKTEDGILETHSGLGDQNTHQWGHPLKEVDALPIIDVVCLPALRVTGEGYSQMSAHSLTPDSQLLPPPSCSLEQSGDT